MLRLLLWTLSILSLLAFQWACSSPKVNTGAGGTRVKQTDEDGDLSFEDCEETEENSVGDDDDDTEAEEEDSESDSGEPLFLAAGDTYEGADGVKELLQQNCVACHKDGGTSIPLDTYATAKDNADTILERMELPEDDPLMMPTGNKLSDDEIARVKTWIDGGTEEGTAASDEEEDEDENSEDEDADESDPCGESTGTGDEDGGEVTVGDDVTEEEEDGPLKGAFDQFIKPPQRENCISEGKIYDRELQECTLDIASIECTWAAIKTAFGNSAGITTAQTDLEGDGFILDQCGQTATGKLHVHLYCLAKVSGGACVSEDQLEEQVFVQTRKIKQPE